MIDCAWHDEGTSYHYLPTGDYPHIRQDIAAVGRELLGGNPRIVRGGAWTTDAPFRETEEAIAFAKSEGLLAVDMEAVALYTFAAAKETPVICFAHMTNQRAPVVNDFEKGEADDNKAMVDLAARVARTWRQSA